MTEEFQFRLQETPSQRRLFANVITLAAPGARSTIVAMDNVSVVVPVYNSAASLPELVRRLENVLAEMKCDWEVVLVNDGSVDESWSVLQGQVALNRRIRAINLRRNYGQHAALLCGIRAARLPIIVTLDDDLQNPPEEIPILLQRLAGKVDVVYGTPTMEQHGFLRDLASKAVKLALSQAMGAGNARNVSTFRAFRTSLRDAFADYGSSFVSIDVLLTWGTSAFDSVTVEHHPRSIGTSQYDLRKLAWHAINMVTGFSTVPLRIASLLGFAAAAFGVASLVFVILRYLLLGESVPGFPFLASLIALLSGIQLFALGIIGEYLGRMHFRMLDRPAYVVAAVDEFKAGSQ